MDEHVRPLTVAEAMAEIDRLVAARDGEALVPALVGLASALDDLASPMPEQHPLRVLRAIGLEDAFAKFAHATIGARLAYLLAHGERRPWTRILRDFSPVDPAP